LICPFGATPDGCAALGQLVGARIREATGSRSEPHFVVQPARDLCGPFSGQRLTRRNDNRDHALTVHEATCKTDIIVALGEGGLFTRFKLPHSEIFVSSCEDLFDVTQEHRANLSAADCFSTLVPLLWFLRHAKVPLPEASSPWANWIVDDPNLRPRYGFLGLKELAEAVSRTKAAATIGFIPWNHARTSKEVVQLFRSQWPRLSICVHGCDHTRSEFATKTGTDALQLAALAVSRMRAFESKTAFGYEKVMVFPQGRFTRPALSALRRSALLAAVNTELVDAQTGEGVIGAELLKPAIMSYGGFPLFLRRPPDEPVVNFALDLLLGKPCLIVTHHGDFHAGMQGFMSRVESLNGLEPRLRWTNLENGIAGTYSVRRNVDQTMDVRLFGSRGDLQFEVEHEQVHFTKAEPVSDADLEVRWNQETIASQRRDGELTFTARVVTGRPMTVEVKPVPSAESIPVRQSAKYRLKVAARRYLSEFRDNYVDRSPRIRAGIASARKFVGRG